MMKPMTITKDNFQKEVAENQGTVLLDFWAAWCGPCRMVAPVIDEIAAEDTALTVGKINVDQQRELAAAFHIVSIPTLVVMKNGQVTQQAVGVRSKADIRAML